jgi:dihydroxyacetone kinase
VEQEWQALDHSSIGGLLLKVSLLISKNVGGCSGPIWGTAFMRAGALSKDRTTITLDDLDKMLTAAIEGIQKRGGAQLGDKTLLDSLIPIRDLVHESRTTRSSGRSRGWRSAAASSSRAIGASARPIPASSLSRR